MGEQKFPGYLVAFFSPSIYFSEGLFFGYLRFVVQNYFTLIIFSYGDGLFLLMSEFWWFFARTRSVGRSIGSCGSNDIVLTPLTSIT